MNVTLLKPLNASGGYYNGSLGWLVLLFLMTGCSPAPNTLQGGHLDVTATDNPWLVINYWATWCGPCRKEIPELNALQEKYPTQIRVIGTNFDGLGGEALQQAASDFQMDYDSLLEDPHLALAQPRPRALPSTWLIAPGGAVAAVLEGEQTLESLETALAEAGAL